MGFCESLTLAARISITLPTAARGSHLTGGVPHQTTGCALDPVSHYSIMDTSASTTMVEPVLFEAHH
jgi:hypothetical protein